MKIYKLPISFLVFWFSMLILMTFISFMGGSEVIKNPTAISAPIFTLFIIGTLGCWYFAIKMSHKVIVRKGSIEFYSIAKTVSLTQNDILSTKSVNSGTGMGIIVLTTTKGKIYLLDMDVFSDFKHKDLREKNLDLKV